MSETLPFGGKRVKKTILLLLSFIGIVTIYSTLLFHQQNNFFFVVPLFHSVSTRRILSSPPSSTDVTNQTSLHAHKKIPPLRNKKKFFKQRARRLFRKTNKKGASTTAGTEQSTKKFHYQNTNQLRFLNFGTSRTWGSGLERRLEDAYPYLLSRNTTNLAMRATGPDVPALCTYSMVGKQQSIYDVITLEYHLKSKHKLKQLAFRLRQRYPDATIIFILVRHPFQFIHKPTQKSLRYFVDQAIISEQEEEGSFLTHVDVIESILQKTKQQDWEFREFADSVEEIYQISEAIDGHIFQVNVPNDNNIYHAIRFFAEELYIWDLVHYSEYGHRVVAGGIVAILEANQVKRSDTVNEWSGYDDCHSWLSTGQDTLQHDPNLIMRSFRGNEKYALEATTNNTWIILNNRNSKNDVVVYLGYMATSQKGMYPKMQLLLDKGLTNDNNTTTTIVDPTTSAYPYAVHISETIEIGSIPPGQSKVTFTILENNAQFPFRVTGILMTPPEEIFVAAQNEKQQKLDAIK